MSNKSVTLSVPVGRPLEQILEVCHRARLAVMLRGGTGVGKSQVLESFTRKKGLEFIARDLSLMEPPDLVGLPRLDGAVTRYLPPAFLPTGGKGVLVLEEINRAPSYMRAPCLQLLTARCLNDYRLPDDWWVAAAINPAEDGYDAAYLDPALESRFVQLNVVADPHEWSVWAHENDIHPQVVSYVEADPTAFDSPVSSPRSWAHVSDLLKALPDKDLPSALLQAAIAGCVGQERALAFCTFLGGAETPFEAEEVLRHYKKHQAVLQGWVREGRLDLVQGTVLNVQKKLQPKSEFCAAQADTTAWANLARLLADLPGDLREQTEAFFRERKYPVPRQKKVKKR